MSEATLKYVRGAAAEITRLRAENERLRTFVASIANPDNWEHIDEAHWQYYGFPPFETAAALLTNR